MYTVFSLFPDLFSFSILATAVLRIVTGLFFVMLGKRLFSATRTNMHLSLKSRSIGTVLALLELATGILLIVGLYTQGAALAAMVLSVLALESGLSGGSSKGERPMYILLFVIALALLFLGPGALAIDLPL